MTFGIGFSFTLSHKLRALKATILWRLKVHFWSNCTKCNWSE